MASGKCNDAVLVATIVLHGNTVLRIMRTSTACPAF